MGEDIDAAWAEAKARGCSTQLWLDLTGLGRATPGCYAVRAETPAGPVSSVPVAATTLDLAVAAAWLGTGPGAEFWTFDLSPVSQSFTAEKNGTLDGLELSLGKS